MDNANIQIKKLHQSSTKTFIKVMSPYQTIQYHPLSNTCTYKLKTSAWKLIRLSFSHETKA